MCYFADLPFDADSGKDKWKLKLGVGRVYCGNNSMLRTLHFGYGN